MNKVAWKIIGFPIWLIVTVGDWLFTQVEKAYPSIR